jgi:hypothetical protein
MVGKEKQNSFVDEIIRGSVIATLKKIEFGMNLVNSY